MSGVEALVLGLIQGLTEFLPVSSSGHLVLSQAILGVDAPGISFEVLVHFATLLAIVTAFRRDIWDLIVSFVRGLANPVSRFREDVHFRTSLFVLLGTIPAGIAGLLFEEYVESAFGSQRVAALCLVATGTFLWTTRYARNSGRGMRAGDALTIGCAQAVAMLPGISRSGATIGAGLLGGLPGEDATRFSFLLALPAIAGATVLKLDDLRTAFSTGGEGPALALGMVAAYLSGYLAIRWLLGIVRRGRLYRFAYYCWAVGIVGLVVSL